MVIQFLGTPVPDVTERKRQAQVDTGVGLLTLSWSSGAEYRRVHARLWVESIGRTLRALGPTAESVCATLESAVHSLFVGTQQFVADYQRMSRMQFGGEYRQRLRGATVLRLLRVLTPDNGLTIGQMAEHVHGVDSKQTRNRVRAMLGSLQARGLARNVSRGRWEPVVEENT